MSYFEDIAHDSNIANLQADVPLTGIGYKQYEDAYSIVDRTRYIGSVGAKLDKPPAEEEARTAFGRRILRILHATPDLRFDTQNQWECCYEAESKLLTSLHHPARDEVHRSPIVITDRGKAAAIIKGYGESTCYALLTNDSFGLIRGTFSAVPPEFEFQPSTRPPVAWHLPIETVGSFKPIRFSTFVFSPHERRKLQPPADEPCHPGIITASHQAIVKLATRHLRTAAPIKR